MTELTHYPVVWKDGELVFRPTEDFEGKVYPAKGTEYREFDTFAEAEAFIEEQGLKEAAEQPSGDFSY